MLRNPEEIQITIETSIKGKESFLLTSDLLYYPGINKQNLSKFPFITNQFRYPEEMIQSINSYGYEKVISFFFRKEYFKSKLGQFYSDQKEIEEIDQATKNKNLEYNLNVMLQYLFQTKFPFRNNYTDSYHEYILKEGSSNLTIRNSIYSYLKLNNVVYTILKCTLLNDLINNPIYRSFTNEYVEFNEWRSSEKDKVSKVINEKFDILLRRLTNDTIYYVEEDFMKIFYAVKSIETPRPEKKNKINNSLLETIDRKYEKTRSRTESTPYPISKGESVFSFSPQRVGGDKSHTSFNFDTLNSPDDIKKDLLDYFKNNRETEKIKNNFKGIYDEIEEIKKNVHEEIIQNTIDIIEKHKEIFEKDIENSEMKKDDTEYKKYKEHIKNLENIIMTLKRILSKINNKGENIQKLSLILLNKDIEGTKKYLIDVFSVNLEQIVMLSDMKNVNAAIAVMLSLINELSNNEKLFKDIQKKIIQKEYIPIQETLELLYENYIEIDKYYKKILGTDFTLKYIPVEFPRILSKCINEVKTLLTQNRIKTHIERGDLNLRLEEDEKEFTEDLEKNYPVYKKYIDKIKSLTGLESTNTELQSIILKYYKSNDNTFPEILDLINKKDINGYKKKDLLNCGITIVKEKEGKYYSVFVALDLAEMEINDKNKDTVKCIYRSLRLGNMAQNYGKNYFDEKKYRMLIKSKYTKDNSKPKSKLNPNPIKVNKGGSTTKKLYKSKTKNKTRRASGFYFE